MLCIQSGGKKGRIDLFLLFCPYHGHCYGGHIVPHAEGRKDPFHSIFCFMPEAPQVFIYDFACSLEEYCMNREPRFFARTRFFHDVFHGVAHKCSSSFKVRRLQDTRSINSSIAEQFNSFLKNIRRSCTNMSQSRFIFLVQVAIAEWNARKRDRLAEQRALVQRLAVQL